ncbi:MAG: hypothetical protein LUG84_02540 [Akkermansiaceae bacterium]|nr:hypothetical protein [Akkermansiaceae bacterium]
MRQAQAALSLPAGRLRHAQFWLLNATPADADAFRLLNAGEVEKAIELWENREDASSLQNRVFCHLLRGEPAAAMACAQRLYAGFPEAFARLIDESLSPTEEELAASFLDETTEGESACSFDDLIPAVTSPVWRAWFQNRLTRTLTTAAEACRTRRKERKEEALSAGRNLHETIRTPLKQLELLVTAASPIYSSMADEAAQEILLCAINFFNNADSPGEAARPALELLEAAKRTAAGEELRKRCDRNEKTIRKALQDSTPASETGEAGKSIVKQLECASKQEPCIEQSRKLLSRVRPHLRTLRKSLGRGHSAYLELSTRVVRMAMQGIIAELNAKLDAIAERWGLRLFRELNAELYTIAVLEAMLINAPFTAALGDAWSVIRKLDFCDMETSYRNGFYKKNREKIKAMCEKASIRTWHLSDLIRRYPKCALTIVVFAVIFYCGYTPNFCDDDGEVAIQRRAAAKKRIKELKHQKAGDLSRKFRALADLKEVQTRQEQARALVQQYRTAQTKDELEAFLSSAGAFRGNDAELEQCRSEARKRIEELDRQEKWGTDELAWNTAQKLGTIDACRTYLEFYPRGKHAKQANKKIIDEEVNRVFASGDYGSLPATEQTRRVRSSTTTIQITNNTGYTLTLSYSGKESKKLEISAHATQSVTLPSATYRVTASVNSSSVRPFAGEETYCGGEYKATYYISSSPYTFSPSHFPGSR